MRSSLFLSVVVAIALLLGATAHAEYTCRNMFRTSSVVELTPTNSDLIKAALGKVAPEILRLEKLPTWQDFGNLQTLHDTLENQLFVEKSKSDTEPTAETAADLKHFFSERFEPQTPQKNHNYQPTEYQMHQSFRSLLESVHRLLPASSRFKLEPMPDEGRPLRTQLQSQKLMKHMITNFEKLFSTTGFKDLQEYKAAVKKTRDKTLIENFKLLEEGNFEISIRRPERGRFWIPKVGFHNQFVTGSSKGYYTPSGRNHVEASWTGFDYEQYSRMNGETKPKYGSIRPRPDDSLSTPGNSEQDYGQDIFILKVDTVKDRLTFNLGDTNNLSVFNSKGPLSWTETVRTPEAWDQGFIPWNYRTLLAPFLIRSKFGVVAPPKTEILDKTFALDTSYFEVQIFGELKLDDVKAFEFTQNPPQGEFLAALLKHNIEIRDGRRWPAKKWTP
jgi:uncharacterized protein YaaR (DUF327 family)